MRTRPRTGEDGERDGGRPFGRAHIHHILTNPVYAGRIRHKAAVYAGQHPAIIRPDDWDAMQLKLQSDGRKARGGATQDPAIAFDREAL
ncbi:recombinase family protein [Pontivivens ytuae]|uniref:recombinase family protein n=1 Tax=Pontivivens ytuae TaxID=2789856 RepID=UPI0030CCC4D3